MARKKILITGATSGIGYAIAEYLASLNSYELILIGRNQSVFFTMKEKLKDALVATYSFDLTNIETIECVFDDLKNRNIKLDGLIHCAGNKGTFSPIRSVKVKNLAFLMKLHYEVFVEMARLYYKKSASNEGGSIIGISSLDSLICQKNIIDYSASKAALNAAVKVMSKEFLKRNIRVNAILPANVDTPMCSNLKELIDIASIQPMGLIDPREIAYLAEFLLSDKAKYITGALIPVSAGMEY